MNPKSQVIGCFHNVVVNEERIDVGAGAGVAVVDVLSQLELLCDRQGLHYDKHWQMLQSDDPKDVGGSTDLAQLLPWNVDLAPVHKLDYVGHGLSIQLQAKVLESEDDGCLDLLFAKLVLEESAGGSHDHLVDVDVVILTDDVKVQEAGLCPQLLQLLTEDPAVVLDHDAQGTMNKSSVTALAPELELEVVRIFLQSDTTFSSHNIFFAELFETKARSTVTNTWRCLEKWRIK